MEHGVDEPVELLLGSSLSRRGIKRPPVLRDDIGLVAEHRVAAPVLDIEDVRIATAGEVQKRERSPQAGMGTNLEWQYLDSHIGHPGGVLHVSQLGVHYRASAYDSSEHGFVDDQVKCGWIRSPQDRLPVL